MRSIMIVGLIVLNVVLAAAVFATVQRQPVASLWEDCCRGGGPGAYCCRRLLLPRLRLRRMHAQLAP